MPKCIRKTPPTSNATIHGIDHFGRPHLPLYQPTPNNQTKTLAWMTQETMERVNAVGTVESKLSTGSIVTETGTLRRRQPCKKGDVVVTTLRKEDNDQMESCIISTINKWAMTAPTNDYAHAVTDQLRGSHDGTDKTLPQYNKYWLELGGFAFLIGDYLTATICSDKQRPKDPLPAYPNMVGTFYQYKSLSPLNRVKDLHNNHVKFVNGPQKGEYVVGSCALLHDGEKKGTGGGPIPPIFGNVVSLFLLCTVSFARLSLPMRTALFVRSVSNGTR